MKRKIQLTQGKYAIIDDADFLLVSKYKWHYAKDNINSGYAISSLYQGINKSPKTIRMHRLIINAKKNENVDHINQNKLDNRKKNLRVATHSQNGMNRCKFIKNNLTSKYKGVYWYIPTYRGIPHWRAEIIKNRKHIRLGRFKTEKEAARAYNKKAKELFGKFANLNKI